MSISNNLLLTFTRFWKEETGEELALKQAIAKLRKLNKALEEDGRLHKQLKQNLTDQYQ